MSTSMGRAVRLALVVVLAWLVTSEIVWAAGAVRKAPAPTWVAGASVPPAKAERRRQVQNGLYFLFLDQQVRPGSPDVHYRRTVYEVTDRSGLESAGSIDIELNPQVQDMVLHQVRVIRAGRVQERLGAISPRLIDREEESAKGVYTGWKTAHVELDDVRVGDVVDYAYSIETRDPQMRGHLSAGRYLGWEAPVGLGRLRLVWPRGRPLTIKRYVGAAEPRVTRAGAEDIYEWVVTDPDPIPEEERAPAWVDQRPWVRISSMTRWSDVANWEAPLYAQSDRLPAAWEAKIDRIARASSDPSERITQALRLVQDEVRYVSLSLGPGAYRPRAPEAVVRSGYGDCKDKALLLAVILRRLGVDATPALTESEFGHTLPEQAPSVGAFDHVIVRVRLNGATHWLDPTRSHQGGRFPGLKPLSYEWALPIVPGQARLEAVAATAPDQPTMDVEERFEAPRTAGKPLRFTVVTTYRDGDADWIRGALANGSPADLEQKYVKFYNGLYPGIVSVRPLEIADDRDANVVTVREAYELPAASLDKLRLSFPLQASSMDDYEDPPSGERRHPLSLPFPVNKHHRIVLVTPGAKPPAPREKKIDTDAFSFSLDVERKRDTLTLDYRLTAKKPWLEPGEVAEYRGFVANLDNVTYSTLNLKSTAGGSIGDEYAWLAIAILVVFGAVVLAILVVGLRWGVRADDAYAADGVFYPVSVPKFVVMGLLTAGLYDIFWMWKCWRWVKARERRPILPFWRAFFGVLWLYGLFDEVNHRLGARALPTWIGVTAAIAYFACSAASGLSDRIPNLPPALSLIFLAAFLCLLPTVVAVRRMNVDAPQAMAANSRFTRYSFAAIGGGVLWWTLILYGTFG